MSDSSVWLHRLRQEKRTFSLRPRGLHWEEQSYLSLYGLDKVKDDLNAVWTGGYTHILGHDIFIQAFQPDSPKGTALVCHGYYDHSGIYWPMVECLLKANYAVIMFDQPGHGLSSGTQASIDNFGTYIRVLEHVIATVFKDDELPKPFVLVGQSMGGAVSMEYLLRHEAEQTSIFSDTILLAPLVRPLGWRAGQIKLKMVAPFVEGIKRVFKENSHDKEFLHFLRNVDPLQSRRLTTAWVLALKDWLEEFLEKGGSKAPLLVLQGTDERTVDADFNLKIIQEKFSEAEIYMIPEAKHHMVRESHAYRVSWMQQIHSRLAKLI